MSTLEPSQERTKKSRKGLRHGFDAVDLRIFLNMHQAEKLDDIAEKIGITKQAVSMRISKLEKQLGIALIQHNPLRLTEAGHHLKSYAEGDEEARRKLLLNLAGLKSSGGFLRIVAISSVLIDDANPVLAETQNEFIHINSTLIEGAAAKIIELVREGKADIGLIGKDSATEGLVFERYRTTQAVLLTHPGHPLGGRKNMRLKDLEPYRIVELPQANILAQKIIYAQVKYSALVRPIHTAPDMETAAQYAATMPMGATIVLEDVANRYAQFYGAKIAYFNEPWKYFDLYTVTREIERRSEAMTFFINKLRKRYKGT